MIDFTMYKMKEDVTFRVVFGVLVLWEYACVQYVCVLDIILWDESTYVILWTGALCDTVNIVTISKCSWCAYWW